MTTGIGISDLLRKYGTSLEETRALMGELMPAIEARRREAEFPFLDTPQFFTPEDVAGLGLITTEGAPFTLEEGWQLKITPGVDGGEPSFSLISPEGWEVLEDQTWLSPEGERYTIEQFEQLQARQPEIPLPMLYGVQELKRWAGKEIAPEEYTRIIAELAAFDEADWERFYSKLMEEGPTPENEAFLRQLGATDEEIEDIFAAIPPVITPASMTPKTMEERTLLLQGSYGKWVEFSPEALDSFFSLEATEENIIEWAWENVYLKSGETIAEAWGDRIKPWLDKWSEAEAKRHVITDQVRMDLDYLIKLQTGIFPPPSTAEQAVLSFGQGIIDVIGSIGGVLGWLGYEEVAADVSEARATLDLKYIAQMPLSIREEFEWSDLLDVDFYATKVTRTVPFALSLIPMAIGGFIGGSAVAGAMGLGRIGTWLVGTFGGVVMSRPAESALEAGETWNLAIAEGKTKEEADKAAHQVFVDNLALAGADAFEIAIAFAPTPGWVPKRLVQLGLVRTMTIAGKVIIVGLSEGGEEIYQDIIQRRVRGEEWQWDAISKEVFVLGTIMGMGMGLSGAVLTRVMERTRDNLPPPQVEALDDRIGELKEEGVPEKAAELQALEELTGTDAVVSQTVKDAIAETAEEREATEAYEMQAEMEGLKEWLGTEPATKLIRLVKITREAKAGEVTNLTIRQYREFVGREPLPISLTKDKKHVRWEAALDDIAPELGYENAQQLKDAIEKVHEARQRVKYLEKVTPEIAPPSKPAPSLFAQIETLYGEMQTEITAARAALEGLKGEEAKVGRATLHALERELKTIRNSLDKFQQQPDLPKTMTHLSTSRAARRLRALEAITRERKEGEVPRGTVRHPSFYKGPEDFNAEVNRELFYPIKESPLDVAAAVYWRSGDFAAYVANMPSMSELKLQTLTDEVRVEVEELSELQGQIQGNIQTLGRELQTMKPETAKYIATEDEIAQLERDAAFLEKWIVELEKGKTITAAEAVSLGIALRRTKGGRLVPAIRRSGFYVTTDFAEYPNFSDVGYRSGRWMDTQTMMEAIDGGFATGMAQRHILWPTQRTHLAQNKFVNAYQQLCQNIFEKYGLVGDKKLIRASFDIIQQIGTEDIGVAVEEAPQRYTKFRTLDGELHDIDVASPTTQDERGQWLYSVQARDGKVYFQVPESQLIQNPAYTAWERARLTPKAKVSVEELLARPEIKVLVAQYSPQIRARLVGFAQEVRVLLDDLWTMQNDARARRGQDTIAYRKDYLAWVAQTNIWSKFGIAKKTPADIFAQPPLPDYIVPDAPFNARAIAREGGMRGYEMEKNVHRLLFDYIRTAGKDIFYTNIIQNAKIHVAALRSMGYENSARLIEDWASEAYGGVKPGIEKAVESILPRTMTWVAYKVRRNLTRAVFPLNWQWNITIQPSSIAFTVGRYGVRNTIRGLDYIFMPSARTQARQAYAWIIKSRRGGKMAYQDIGAQVEKNLKWEGSLIDKAENLANFVTNTMESILTGISVRAAHHYGTRLGYTGRDLLEYASKGGAKTQSMYNFEDVPGVLRAKPVGTIAPFQTFCFQAFNYIRELNFIRVGKAGAYHTISAKSAEGRATISNRLKLFVEFMVCIWLINMVVDKATNRKPWILSSFIPFYSNFVMGTDATNPWNWPMPVQYVTEFWKAFEQVIKYDNFDKFRKWVIRYHTIGGTQINRMITGIEAVIRGGVYDVRGTEMFAVNPEEWLRAVLMGPYQTEGGKEYIDNLREKDGKWYEYIGIPLPERINIVDEIDKNLALLGTFDETGMLYDFRDFVSDLRQIRQRVGDMRFDKDDSPFVQGFLEAEKARARLEEIDVDLRDEWRKANPKDDARLAMWGFGGRIQTQEAYDFIKEWCGELGVSLEHLSAWLPPEEIAEVYFQYIDAVSKYGANSAEAKLIRAENPAFQEWGVEAYDWGPIEALTPAMEITVKWREQDDLYEALTTTEERTAFLEANPEYAVARLQRDAYGYGFPEPLVDTYVEYYQLPGKAGDFYDAHPSEVYYEDDWFLLEHPDFYQAALEHKGWQERDFSKVPTRMVWELYKQWVDVAHGTARREFEAANPTLDYWLNATKGTKLENDLGDAWLEAHRGEIFAEVGAPPRVE